MANIIDNLFRTVHDVFLQKGAKRSKKPNDFLAHLRSVNINVSVTGADMDTMR